MKSTRTERGFGLLSHATYPPDGTSSRLAQESSVIGDYCDALEKPGSSALWIGGRHHLGRDDVRELVSRLEHWLATGNLAIDD